MKYTGPDQEDLLKDEGEHGFSIGLYSELALSFKATVDDCKESYL